VQEKVAKYKCDNCRRSVYTDRSTAPDGWRRVKIWDEGNEPEPANPQDICDSCSSAVLTSLGRRKAIERGTHHEPPAQEHPKSPQACDAQAKIIAARVAGVAT